MNRRLAQGQHEKKENKRVGSGVVSVSFLPFGSGGRCFGIGNDGKQWHLGFDVPFLFFLGFSATQRSDGADNS